MIVIIIVSLDSFLDFLKMHTFLFLRLQFTISFLQNKNFRVEQKLDAQKLENIIMFLITLHFFGGGLTVRRRALPPSTPPRSRCNIKYHPEKRHDINSIPWHTGNFLQMRNTNLVGGELNNNNTTPHHPSVHARTDTRTREQSCGLETDALSIGKRLEVKWEIMSTRVAGVGEADSGRWSHQVAVPYCCL